MAAVNDALAIERVMSPDDIIKLRSTFPTLLEALRIQQVVINQVITRVGGSGSGSDVSNLDELIEEVDSLNPIRGIAGSVNKLAEKVDQIQPDVMLIMLNKARSEVKELQSQIADQEYVKTMIGRINSRLTGIENRIEEVESLCLSSLAR